MVFNTIIWRNDPFQSLLTLEDYDFQDNLVYYYMSDISSNNKRIAKLGHFPKVLWRLLPWELCSKRRLSSPFIFQVATSFQYMGRCNLSLGTYARKPYQWSLQNVSCEETCHLLCRFHAFLWRGKTQGLTLSPQWSLFIFPRTK